MRKYKHKKTNNIAIQDGNYYNVENSVKLPYWVVVESNDWEEIIEKDYLILEIKSVGGYHWIYDEKTEKYVQNKYYFQHCLDDFFENNVLNSGYFIFKVKRLSDNEIFTVGDKCNDDFIKEIKLVVNENRLYFSSKNLSWGKSIKDLIKDKIILITTEDGKKIYDTHELWVVTKEFKIITTLINERVFIGAFTKYLKVFSTKEAAQEWVVFNKPCLSLNDVKNCCLDNLWGNGVSLTKIEKLVKSKLHD